MNVHGIDLIERGDMVCRHPQPFEPESVAVWKSVCRDAPLVLDVGCYTGLYALLALKAGAHYVYGFDPNQHAIARAKHNAQVNRLSPAFIRMGVGDTRTSAKFSTHGRSVLTSIGSILQGVGDTRITTIDHSFDDRWSVAAIKIDVEGYEPNVIRGAAKTIERCRPLIIAEVLTDEAERTIRDMLDGYDFTKADGRNLICIAR